MTETTTTNSVEYVIEYQSRPVLGGEWNEIGIRYDDLSEAMEALIQEVDRDPDFPHRLVKVQGVTNEERTSIMTTEQIV